MESEAKAARSRHLFVLTKKQGAYFFGKPEVCDLGVSMVLTKNWRNDGDLIQKIPWNKKSIMPKRYPPENLTYILLPRYGLSRWFPGFPVWWVPCFLVPWRVKPDFCPGISCSWFQTSRRGGMLLPKQRRRGDAGVVILPKSTTEMDHFMLEHHLWMVLQGLEAMFLFSHYLDENFSGWWVGVYWDVCCLVIVHYLLYLFSLGFFMVRCFYSEMLLWTTMFSTDRVFLSWLGNHHLFSTFKCRVFKHLKGRPSTLQHLQVTIPWHVKPGFFHLPVPQGEGVRGSNRLFSRRCGGESWGTYGNGFEASSIGWGHKIPWDILGMSLDHLGCEHLVTRMIWLTFFKGLFRNSNLLTWKVFLVLTMTMCFFLLDP